MDIIELIKDSSGVINNSKMLHKWHAYMDTIKKSGMTVEHMVSPAVAIKYNFNFYGLLRELDIPEFLYYPHLLLNGMKSSNDYKGDTFKIMIINDEYVNGIYNKILIELEK
jgi:hypothetical protein